MYVVSLFSVVSACKLLSSVKLSCKNGVKKNQTTQKQCESENVKVKGVFKLTH